ncbi:EAL domain-containing protein [Synechococcus sp. CS-1328]|uniref:EAL domain-containing protein n=1 Tax=Synechococcus sp. CS-1328 TaxID=2847976 RepID=UPI00223B6B80|nr:EAL domain-containing protein [Synechococcus sp. CS-1328]MCT0225637.1 EAL domain-containing protein [Synechococcus sp. CS-1328]
MNDTYRIDPVLDLASGRIRGGLVQWWPDGRLPEAEQREALEEDPAEALAITLAQWEASLHLLDRLSGDLWLAVTLPPLLLDQMRGLFRGLSSRLDDLEAVRRRLGRRLVIGIGAGCASREQWRRSPLIANLAALHTLALQPLNLTEPAMPRLLALPFQRVSVAAELVQGADADSRLQRFLLWLTGACHAIDATINAEGVCSGSELALLRRLGLDEASGPYWGAPLTPQAFLEKVAAAPGTRVHAGSQAHRNDPAIPGSDKT